MRSLVFTHMVQREIQVRRRRRTVPKDGNDDDHAIAVSGVVLAVSALAGAGTTEPTTSLPLPSLPKSSGHSSAPTTQTNHLAVPM